MKNKTYIIGSAGGNVTAIKILNSPRGRDYYAKFGRNLIFDNQNQKVEQAGFLILPDNHFEMSGGEFCGNAARAVAIIISKIKNTAEPQFTMSGFKGTVFGFIKNKSAGRYLVKCSFPAMSVKVIDINLNGPVKLVDMDGIVHVVIEKDFPIEDFKKQHYQIRQQLNLEDRDAVGVIWTSRSDLGIKIDPVVWVKEIDSFFYESSCGSGSIAVAKALNISKVIQPTGDIITVEINGESVSLESSMEVINED